MNENKEMVTMTEMHEDGTCKTYDLEPQYPTTSNDESGSVLPLVGLGAACTAAVIGVGVLAKRKFKKWKAEHDEFKAWKEARNTEVIDENEGRPPVFVETEEAQEE